MKKYAVLSMAVVLLATLIGLATRPPDGPPVIWRTDLAAATREAKAAGKDVLIEFTVRGEGGALSSLDRAVYDRPEFLQAAGEKFIPVRLVVSTAGGGGGDASIVTLAERLRVAKVPSLVLTDAAGLPYAAVENESTSVASHVDALAHAATSRSKRDKALASAAVATGDDRARHLHAALQNVGRFALCGYESTVAEVVSLDPGNRLGLRDQYAEGFAALRVDRSVQATVYPLVDRADFAGAAAAVDALIAAEKPPVAVAQKLVAFKAQLLFSAGRKDDARRLLGEALAMAPGGDTVDAIRTALDSMND